MIVLAGSRQVRCVFDVLARWTLENDQTYDVFDTSLIQYCVMTLCVRHSLRHYSNKRALYAPSDSLSLSNVCFEF